MGVMAFTVKEFLKRVPAARLRPGDVWYLNLPEVGGNHLPDVKAIRPVFAGHRLVAFAINLAHWADIGGAVPGSYVPWATECYQEGVRIPPLRLFSADGPDHQKIDFLLSNVRGRDERQGDLFAQFAANDVAARRLDELVERYGADTLTSCFDALHAASEAGMRAAIRALPDGVWEGEDWLDDDGVDDRPLPIRVRVEIRGDEAAFDFTRTAPQARGPVNTTYFIACSAVYHAMKTLAGPDVPPNDGCYRPLRVVVPPRTLLSADPDRPVVGGNHETSQRVVDAIFRRARPRPARSRRRRRADHVGRAHFRRPRRRRPVGDLLRDPRRRRRGQRGARRRVRPPRPHVERHEHADRGGRGGVPAARGGARAPPGLGG